MYFPPILFISSGQIPVVPRTPFLTAENARLPWTGLQGGRALCRPVTLWVLTVQSCFPFYVCLLSLSKNCQQFFKPNTVAQESDVFSGLCVAALCLAWRAYMGPFKWIDWALHFITFNRWLGWVSFTFWLVWHDVDKTWRFGRITESNPKLKT